MPNQIIYPLTNYGDDRGFCFTIPAQAFDFLGHVQEMHVVQLLPGAIRGNHYHQQRKEALIVFYEDEWLLAWQKPNEGDAQQQIFSGQGAVLITLEPNTIHALKNTGHQNITAISCSNLNVMDTVRQVLVA
jgi:dTDP-4-dehydrorhamnose 3,5-epimerase-like enzyme